MGIEFIVSLQGADYRPNTGWPCPALAISGATVKRVVIAAVGRNLDDFEIGGGYIRDKTRKPDDPAQDAAVTVVLEKKLVTLDTAVIVAILGLLGTLGAALIGHYTAKEPDKGKETGKDTSVLRITLDTLTQKTLSPREVRSDVATGRCDAQLTYCVDISGVGKVPLPRNGIVLGKQGGDSSAIVRLDRPADVSVRDVKFLRIHQTASAVSFDEVSSISCRHTEGEVLCEVHDS